MMEFLGSELTPAENEVLALRIDRTHREGEADLIRSRWFDYCRLHPVTATYLYAHVYKEQTQDFYASYIDCNTAENARAFTPDDIFHSKDLTSMWLARRSADAMGLPYEFVMRFAKQRALERHFRHFLRPNQLYGEEFEIDLAAAWKEALATSLRYSRLETFKTRNFSKQGRSFWQEKHIRFVVDQIKRRASRMTHISLAARMLHEGILDMHAIEEHFGADLALAAGEQAQDLAVSHC